MKPIQIISQDVFDKIRSRFENLEMGDESGAVTIDPAEARFFDFDFVHEDVNLGRVSISLNDLGSLKVYYSQGITENQDDPAKQLWYNFLKEMRQFAMRRLLRFDTRDVSKTNLDKNDFQFLANKGPKDNTMKMNESRWNHKSTKKTSRAVKGSTEVVVRHTQSMEEMAPGQRSHPKKIKAIYIQNKLGERYLYPFIHPAGAFAMAQHVDHGGVPHDPAGKAIVRMSEEIAKLQEFQRTVRGSQLHDDAMGITDRAVGRLNELKACVERISKRHHYESWIAEFNEQEQLDDDLMELDPVTMEEYKSKFTQNNFNETLAQYFPLLDRIMKEANKLDLEKIVSEDESEPEPDHDDVREAGFDQFEEWAEAVEQGILTNDQIEELKIALDDLEAQGQKLELAQAADFFKGHGIEDEELETNFENQMEIDPSVDPMDVFKAWAKDNYPEILVPLGLTTSNEPSKVEPQVPDSPAPTEPDTHPEPMAQEPAEKPVAEGKNTMFKEVAEIVKKFYNEDNDKVGPVRSPTAVCIEVEKTIKEKYGEAAGKKASMVAEKFIEQLTQKWEEKHHKDVDSLGPNKSKKVETDGLQRLRELVGTIKQKLEGIGDQGHSGEDFNKNIMPAEGNVQATAQQFGQAAAELDTAQPEMESILKLAGLKK